MGSPGGAAFRRAASRSLRPRKRHGSRTQARRLRAARLPAAAQQFVLNTADIPQGYQRTEQIDFADVDLDGDWDAALANGAPAATPKQNQLWINQGHLQGGPVGFFLDETVLRLPALLDVSRDIEFADIDGDGDHDLYILADSKDVNAGARWWVNAGGEQGGVLGFYEDQTAARWIGLGLPGSSINPALILPSGTFIDWSNDGDFADFDGDGDLDLVHSSYGETFGGMDPTRIFLNDGDGHFSELNPSGVMLAGSKIPDGTPALWCDGLQKHNTFDTTGAEADIADNIVGFELGDTDGDFDVDIVSTGRSALRPRFFRNRLEQGSLAFRDESALAFPGVTLNHATFEQELGDLDGDGDLDLYGLNWAVGLALPDLTLENVGGVFLHSTILPGSGDDEEEGDFIDYDNDGDLDLFVANFSGQEQLYQNQGGVPATFINVTATKLPTSPSGQSHDGEVADVDEDGDYDVFVANGTNSNVFFENMTQVPDLTLPRIPAVEALGAAPAGPGGRRVRACVLDNAGYYTVWYYPVVLETTVDGILLPELSLANSGGTIFRGELPANLVGQVSYRVRATDFYGNSGVSAPTVYTATGDAGASYGAESASTGAAAPALRALSEARAGAPLYLAGQGLPGRPGFLGIALASLPPLAVTGLPNLVLNIDPGSLLVSAGGIIGSAGDLVFPLDVPAGAAGVAVFAQFLDLGPDGTFGSSKGLSLTIR